MGNIFDPKSHIKKLISCPFNPKISWGELGTSPPFVPVKERPLALTSRMSPCTYVIHRVTPPPLRSPGREPNQRGLKLLEMADYFNLCPINLLGLCDGPIDTFISHCGRYRSTLDYIFVPNCLFNEIYSAKTFDHSHSKNSHRLEAQ